MQQILEETDYCRFREVVRYQDVGWPADPVTAPKHLPPTSTLFDIDLVPAVHVESHCSNLRTSASISPASMTTGPHFLATAPRSKAPDRTVQFESLVPRTCRCDSANDCAVLDELAQPRLRAREMSARHGYICDRMTSPPM